MIQKSYENSEYGKLYLIPTPIGNLDDITLRAIKTLEMVDIVYAEDTRETLNLLKYLKINKKVESCHKYTEMKHKNKIVQILKSGKNIGYVTDRGTPLISDPGNVIVDESIKENITVTCSDGAVWCKTKSNCFDRILLDAPCSSERHVLQDEKYLAQWSPARIKTLSMEQWALLSSAYRMLKDNGILLYSTCALAPKENDEVIERLFKKFDNCVNLSFESEKYQNLKNDEAKLQLFTDNVSLPDFERTKYGYQILPDKQNGAGPIYFSIIMKKLNISSN